MACAHAPGWCLQVVVDKDAVLTMDNVPEMVMKLLTKVTGTAARLLSGPVVRWRLHPEPSGFLSACRPLHFACRPRTPSIQKGGLMRQLGAA